MILQTGVLGTTLWTQVKKLWEGQPALAAGRIPGTRTETTNYQQVCSHLRSGPFVIELSPADGGGLVMFRELNPNAPPVPPGPVPADGPVADAGAGATADDDMFELRQVHQQASTGTTAPHCPLCLTALDIVEDLGPVKIRQCPKCGSIITDMKKGRDHEGPCKTGIGLGQQPAGHLEAQGRGITPAWRCRHQWHRRRAGAAGTAHVDARRVHRPGAARHGQP